MTKAEQLARQCDAAYEVDERPMDKEIAVELRRLSAELEALKAAMGEPVAWLCERICSAIKATDDKSVDEAGYMLDSNDCIRIVRECFASAPPAPQAAVVQPMQKGCSTCGSICEGHKDAWECGSSFSNWTPKVRVPPAPQSEELVLWKARALQAEAIVAKFMAPQAAVMQQEPVGEVGSMPGTSGFTMACFRADEVPVGTKLYTLKGIKP